VNGSIQEASDLELMAQVAGRDRAAFGQLYDRYSGLLFSVAMRILRDDKESEDVLQEVFLQIWNKAAAYDRSLGKPLNWFITITRNRCLDRLRALKRSYVHVHELSEAAEEEAEWTPNIDGAERALAVRGAMQLLPTEQREAIEHAFFGGLTHEQIAERLRQPLGTIKARIRRGMLKLRESLEAQL
jgi:RNA polymerase sigma-70 factor, ECF subfamily